MDPASAIGVAAATVQFFAIGIKAIRLGKQVCASKAGSTEADEALETSLRAISDIRKDLRHTITRDADSNIAKAQKQCLEVAGKLLKVLESNKASSQTAKSKFLKDVSATWQVMRARSKIDKLEQELRVAQNHFKQALTVETRNAIAQVLENQGNDTAMLQSLWDEIQQLRPELQQVRIENRAAHHETLSGVARVENSSLAQHTIIQSSHQATLGAIGDLDINIQTQFSDMRVTDIHQDILESLRYPDMLTRQQEISPPATGTYEWIFTGESPYQNVPDIDKALLSADLERRKKLLHWFSNDESLFWINGKPGSGKSSLMSFVANDQRTLQALKIWAGQGSVHIIKFFFWRPGSPLQRSVPGMLRSLLYQVLMADIRVIDKLLIGKSLRRHPTWEQTELLRTLENVLRHQSKEHICFFIDGLDEHDGDYMSLLGLILQTHVTSNVKICLSSRPEPAFRLRLTVCSSISMQDLNRTDIETLVQQKLKPLNTISNTLVEEVTRRAEGIIFWAALVCSSLLRGFTMHDDETILRMRLDETPSGLKDLFCHMFSKIDKVHREHLKVYCHLLKWASETEHMTNYTSLILITAVLQCETIGSLDRFVDLCARTEQQVVGQGQGIIEISRLESELSSERGIWSLAQVAEQGIPQSRYHTSTKQLLSCSHLHIQWVHRSAHDCIFGDAGESVAPWISMMDDRELRDKVVKGLIWLAKHSPMVCIWETGRPGGFLVSNLGVIMTDIVPLTTIDEGCKIVDDLQKLIISSFPGANRLSSRKELQDVGTNEHPILIELLPLMSFWQGILDSGRPGRPSYIVRLVDKPFAAVVCSRLISYPLAAYAHDAFLTTRLFDCISRHLRILPEHTTVSADFLYNRQFGFREILRFDGMNGKRISVNFHCRIVLSWLGSSDLDQADTMHGLAGIRCRASQLDPSWPRILGLLELRNVWRGPQAIDENRELVPLQFLLPNRAFMRWSASDQPLDGSLPDGPLSCFRIICTDRKERINVSQILQKQLVFQPAVVAVFDLGSAATTFLLSQKSHWAFQSVTNHAYALAESLDMTWFGTAADYSICLRTILDDIWANRDHQLDAWQQLYALACVKLWFKCMWKIGDEAEVADWQSDVHALHEAFASESS
ncbi:hypothetical protein MBLNU13_g02885t1 [Cladosporium sp. NU13]